MGTIIDATLLVLLGLFCLFGLWKGAVKKTITVVIIIVTCFISYFILKSTMLDYLRYSFLYDVTKGSGIVINLTEQNLTFRVMSIEDLFVVLQNFDSSLSSIFLKMTCESFCKYILLIVSVLISYILSGIISFILYHLLFKFIVPVNSEGKRTPGVISRLLGAVIGLIQGLVVVYIGLLMFIPLEGIKDVLPKIYEVLIQYKPEYNTQEIKQWFDLAANFLQFDNSMVLKFIINGSSAVGIDLHNLFKFEIDGTVYSLNQSLNILSNSIVEVVESFLESSGQTGGNQTQALMLINDEVMNFTNSCIHTQFNSFNLLN